MRIVTDLKPHIRHLATVKPSVAPVISCYLNLERGTTGFQEFLNRRVRALRASFIETPVDLEEALKRVDAFTTTELAPEARGAAIFACAVHHRRSLRDQHRLTMETDASAETWDTTG